jgi:hypothetical protein
MRNKSNPQPRTFRIALLLIGIFLLLFAYYDPVAKDFLGIRAGKFAVSCLLLTVGILWYWFLDWRRNTRSEPLVHRNPFSIKNIREWGTNYD